MIKYAILGYGTVGTGVAEVMAERTAEISSLIGEEIDLKYILVRRMRPADPFADRMVMDFSVIENDPEVSIVAEVIGGTGDAYEYSKRALAAGKSLVSSNKELVAVHGAELAALAKENNVSYLFEGSVGGGIPLLHPLSQCLSANRIDEVFGILNGTTNYILTAMAENDESFDVALKKAQEAGYAEADPTADIEGFDTCRKTAILADLAFGRNMDVSQIPVKGITKITPADLELSSALGYNIKLLGRALRTENGCCAFVEPHLIPQTRLLASVSGVMNACVIRGSAVGEVLMYGPGAGKRATASAVCGDIIEAARHGSRPFFTDLGAPGGLLASEESLVSPWYIRADTRHETVLETFPQATPVYGMTGECGFITEPMDREVLSNRLPVVNARAAYRVLS